MRSLLYAHVLLGIYISTKAQTDEEILTATADVWNSAKKNSLNISYRPFSKTLFVDIDERQLVGTYASLINLHWYYNPYTGYGQKDYCDSFCVKDINMFLDEVVLSRTMFIAMGFLGRYDPLLVTANGIKRYLYDIWFTPYTRTEGEILNSSGFEHVFLGEIYKGYAVGYHNWLKAYFDEKNGIFKHKYNYNVCDPDIPKFSMTMHGYRKNITAMFVGTPPEVELALYTICFRFRPDKLCDVRLGGSVQPIQTYTENCTNDFGNSCVGSAFPRC